MRSIEQPSRFARRQVATKLSVLAGVVIVSALVLWDRQTPSALLRVRSFGGAVAEVVFWAFPAFIVFLVLPRTWLGVIASGTVLAGLTIAQWWSSSTDWHSTASIGPAVTGWVVLPILLVAGGLGARVLYGAASAYRHR